MYFDAWMVCQRTSVFESAAAKICAAGLFRLDGTDDSARLCGMYIVHVLVRVKPEHTQAFKAASAENSANSLLEPGVVRFDVCENLEDPSEFVLVEIYHTKADADLHKQTAHYAKWRDTVESMMAEPRRSKKFTNVSPVDAEF